MATKLEELNKRVEKIEKQKNQEILTLVEILSNATFFGEIKKACCEYAKNGQCSFYIIRNSERNALPLISNCRTKTCDEAPIHYHIETSNITCSLCPRSNNGQ